MEVPTRYDLQCHIGNLTTAACRLVGTRKDVRSVRILPNVRPTYAELCRYQEWAYDHAVRLDVDGKGMITVRPHGAGEE